MKKFILLTLLTLISANSFAAKLYQINVIVFSHMTPNALASENWENRLIKPDLRGAVDLLQLRSFNNYQLLPDSQFGLQKELATLKNQPDYHVLMSLSWTQLMTSAKDAKWIQIYGGLPYDQTGQPMSDHSAQVSPRLWEFNGKIKISFQTFYQIYTRLYLTEPESIIGGSTDSGPIGNFQPIPLRTFYLAENRHTRLNELNYIDHPLFGMVVNVTSFPQLK